MSSELFSPIDKIVSREEASRESWLVAGAGSGGSRVAEEAVRCGIGTIVLVDLPNERLEARNVLRHALTSRDLGRLKVEGVRDRLLEINPQVRVVTLSLDVRQGGEALTEAIAEYKVSQILLCTDNEPSKHAVNQLAIELRIPMIFAGVFDGGCGGEVGVVIPGEACYACISSLINRSNRFSAFEPDPATPVDYSSSPQYPTTNALNIDIAQIALIQTRVALSKLLGSKDPSWAVPGNYILFGNRPVKGLFGRMLDSEIFVIKKNEECMVCGGASTSGDSDAAQQILADIPTETC